MNGVVRKNGAKRCDIARQVRFDTVPSVCCDTLLYIRYDSYDKNNAVRMVW